MLRRFFALSPEPVTQKHQHARRLGQNRILWQLGHAVEIWKRNEMSMRRLEIQVTRIKAVTVAPEPQMVLNAN